jgi:hypothetical protein
MNVLGVTPGEHLTEMATQLHAGVAALARGFAKLATEPTEAEADARAARKAEREAAREARARAAGKDPRHDDDRDETDDTLLLEGEPDDPETATDGDDEKAEGGERRQAVRVVHEPTPGRPVEEPRR